MPTPIKTRRRRVRTAVATGSAGVLGALWATVAFAGHGATTSSTTPATETQTVANTIVTDDGSSSYDTTSSDQAATDQAATQTQQAPAVTSSQS